MVTAMRSMVAPLVMVDLRYVRQFARVAGMLHKAHGWVWPISPMRFVNILQGSCVNKLDSEVHEDASLWDRLVTNRGKVSCEPNCSDV